MLAPSCETPTRLEQYMFMERALRACICAHQQWRSHQTCQLSVVEGKEGRKRPASAILCNVGEEKNYFCNRDHLANVHGRSHMWELLIGVSTLPH